jgi:hypothetical protein
MMETLFNVLCVLLSLIPITRYLRRYVRRYQSTPFLTPVSLGKRTVPFGIVQVWRLAEHQSMPRDDKQSPESF